MVANPVFTKEKAPGQSWVDLGREYGMKAGRSRLKTERTESAVATFLWRFLFPAPDDEPISEKRPLILDGRSQLLAPLRGGWQVLRLGQEKRAKTVNDAPRSSFSRTSGCPR